MTTTHQVRSLTFWRHAMAIVAAGLWLPWLPAKAQQNTVLDDLSSLQVVKSVPKQDSSTFKGNLRPDLTVDTKQEQLDRTPYWLYVGTYNLILKSPEKIVLAGNRQGTAALQIDNFLLFEVFVPGRPVRRAIVENTAPVSTEGKIIKQIGADSFSFGAGEIDITELFPINTPLSLKVSAMDYGGLGYVSDVFLIMQKGTVGLKTEKDKYKSNEPIVVKFTNLPGNQSDWIAVTDATAKADKYEQYQYTDGKVEGTREFKALPEGKYEARLYYDWQGTKTYEVQARYAFVVSDPTEWRAIKLDTTAYGQNEFGDGKVLKELREAAQKFLDRVDKKAAKLAQLLPKAFSISKAVDVFVTYACVNQVTNKIMSTKVVQLADKDTVHWWAKDEAVFQRKEAERDKAIERNRPQSPCQP